MSTQTIEAPVQAPIEVVKPLKLSEAIRFGSMGTQQAFRKFVDNEGGMCVMSTAWYALTGHVERDAYQTPLYQMLSGVVVRHPTSDVPCDLRSILFDLNDKSRWPRHKIADWLEGLGL